MFSEQILAVWPVTDFGTALITSPMQLIAIFLLLDVILGIAAAVASKSFNFNKVADFMTKGVLPYLLGFAVVQMVASGFVNYGQLVTVVVLVIILLKILASIVSNLASLGVNMPSVLKRVT